MTKNAGADTVIKLQTAIENRDDQWADHATLATYTSQESFPQTKHFYLFGSSNSNQFCGFARYLRVKVTQYSSSTLTLSVRLLLKP